ncbi:GtrA family protein [Azospirillum rugosum]|uniref:Flippase GtrA n=1 Tax=Azospirillum rugosum TaxID=416170 RepID=A0ABS4SST1_9PROT|nr:GtrA family protein [Azospirillum rugosum]MBP2295620.1 putative flippase GtrA [Azospirillum rugosum]MDQ0529490.1 putative flippase GtrA [Azospirillum rugosum]
MSGPARRSLRDLWAAVPWTAVRFALVGLLNTGVDFAVFLALMAVPGTPVLLANACGYGVGVLSSFLLNRSWTFRVRRDEAPLARRLPVFLAFNLVGLALSSLVVGLLVPAVHPLAAKVAATVATFAWNYWSSRRFVFTTPASTTPAA